jgi:hypothetical protein
MFKKMTGTDMLVFIGSFAIGDTVISSAQDFGVNIGSVWGTILGAIILVYYYLKLRGK